MVLIGSLPIKHQYVNACEWNYSIPTLGHTNQVHECQRTLSYKADTCYDTSKLN